MWITGNQVVTIPLDVQNFYFLRNSTSGAHTVQFKYVSGSGSSATFSATDFCMQLQTMEQILIFQELTLDASGTVTDTTPQLL